MRRCRRGSHGVVQPAGPSFQVGYPHLCRTKKRSDLGRVGNPGSEVVLLLVVVVVPGRNSYPGTRYRDCCDH
eukprot:630870-Rhodomonas_salina.3